MATKGEEVEVAGRLTTLQTWGHGRMISSACHGKGVTPPLAESAKDGAPVNDGYNPEGNELEVVDFLRALQAWEVRSPKKLLERCGQCLP